MISKEIIIQALSKYYKTSEEDINLDRIRALHNVGKIKEINLNNLFQELAKPSPNLKILGYTLNNVIFELREKNESNSEIDNFLNFLQKEIFDAVTHGADQKSPQSFKH